MKLGMEAKLYRNAGTYGAPNWVEIANCKDLALNTTIGEADVTVRRNNGWRAKVPTLDEASIEFEMVWDTNDPNFTAIRQARFNRSTVEILALSGPVDEPGNEGLRATVNIFKFDIDQKLEDAITVKVEMKPTLSDHAPEWYVVS